MSTNSQSRTSPGLIDLPRVEDSRGNLSFIEGEINIPFKIERAYWIYDVPGGQERDGHANINTDEFIVAISGSFDVAVNDGLEESVFSLNRSYFGLYLPKMSWRTIQNFSTNSLCLVLCSKEFSDTVYFKSRDDFFASGRK